MDASQVQSSSKCGSDFSIERILGDRKDSREESVEVPEWLCCTRYRPPRLPRAAAVCRARRAGRHARVPFTATQAAALEAAYARAPYLAPPALKALAAALQLRDDRILRTATSEMLKSEVCFPRMIKIWFQNRRARERREKSGSIAPPQAVTLPPTTLNAIHTNVTITNAWLPVQMRSTNPIARDVPFHFIDTSNHTDHITCREQVVKCEEVSNTTVKSNCDPAHLDINERSVSPLDIETVED